MNRGALALAVVVIAAAGWAWWRYAPDSLPAFVNKAAPRSPTANPPLYKWRDAKGTIHITDQPPADREFEKIVVDPRTNVVPTVVPGRDEAPPPPE